MEEGVDLPEDLPLTKAEERVLKKVRRKIRNKRSAMESRRRKKEYITTVEEQYESSKGILWHVFLQVINISDENDELKKRVKFLEQQNRNLMSQLRKLQESVMSVSDLIIDKDRILTFFHSDSKKRSCVCTWCGDFLSFCFLLSGQYGPISYSRDQRLFFSNNY